MQFSELVGERYVRIIWFDNFDQDKIGFKRGCYGAL